jgi:hypothetical protein
MVLSAPAINIQLGLFRHAAVVKTALKFSAALSTCDRAMTAACSADKSAAKYSWNLPGSRYVKPSVVFFIAPDLLRSLGKRFPSSASSSLLQRLACALQHIPIRQPIDPCPLP